MPGRTPPWHASDPVADPRAVVVEGRARFTVLTPRLIRLEWAEDGVFEDRPTLLALNRRLPVPRFEVVREGGAVLVRTDALELRHTPSGGGEPPGGAGPFGEGCLSVAVRTGGVDTRWHPGLEPVGNLGGTVRTLDQARGAVPLGLGVASRDGWAVLDDSASALVEAGHPDRPLPRPPGERRDLYFFGHGRDYAGAVADLTRISGPIPLPPRWAFGVWWSRYWAYTDAELEELVSEFNAHEVPLDVLVVDMDWHETFGLDWTSGVKDAAGQPKGWTGYTWSRDRFPDPEGFLERMHALGLRVPLNLHPASGIQRWEACFDAVARRLGLDPGRTEYVPFTPEEPAFASTYFEEVIRPLERQGVDFWWLDWQQGEETGVPGLGRTAWLNHLFFTDMERGADGGRRARPVILHRFGGPGGHRYPMGFSGDAWSTWESLAFQPHFTATAANLAFAYWSHDMGGHEPGPVDPELYTRWLQWGAFSPVLRTHATKHPEAERRVWAFPEPYRSAMISALRLRLRLLPYLYTAARRTYDTGIPFLRPLYYDWPDSEEAYAHPGAYLLGPDLLVRPVTAPGGVAEVWLPPGRWVPLGGGDVVDGGTVLRRRWSLDEIPVFARAGAVVPLADAALRTEEAAAGPLTFVLHPGADGSARVYADAGDDLGYRRGECSWMPVEVSWDEGGSGVRVSVGPVMGTYPGAPASRTVHLDLPAAAPPRSAEEGADASSSGTVPLAPPGDAVTYDEEAGRARVTLGSLPNGVACRIHLRW